MDQHNIYKCYYCHDKCATLADGVKHCVENHTNHVLRYRKLLLDDKSGMMKYHSSYHDGIKPLFIRHCDLS